MKRYFFLALCCALALLHGMVKDMAQSIFTTVVTVDYINRTLILTRDMLESMDGYDPENVVVPEVYYGSEEKGYDGFTVIGLEEKLFFDDTDLVSVSLPDSVTEIPDYCFYGCGNLVSVQFPDGVVSLGRGAFYECTSLKEICLPESVEEIGSYCFSSCTSLESVSLPEGLVSIGDAAFQLCSVLKWIDIPDTVEHIGNYAFSHCSNAGNEVITLPSSLKSLGGDASYPAHMFYDCGMDGVFTEFRISEDNPYYEAVDGILYTKGGETLVAIPRGKTFEDHTYVMPDTVTNLGELSFSRNTDIHTVVISDNLVLSGAQPEDAMEYYLNDGNDLSIACYGYSGVTRYEVKETNGNYISVDGVLYSKDGLELVAVPSKYEGRLVIPDGTMSVMEGAIWEGMAEYFGTGCFASITGIDIPASLVNIPESQVDEWNTFADLYGTEITVDGGNAVYYIEDGHLAAR